MMRNGLWMMCLLGVVAIALPAMAAVELDRRYNDAFMFGYSIQPPAKAERARESTRVAWTRRDDKTGAVAMTLTVRQVVESGPVEDLSKFATALSQRLRDNDRMKVESVNLTRVGDKDAVDVAGQTGGIALYQRQVWVTPDPGRFIVFTITGPADDKANLSAIMDAVMATARFISPEAAKQARQANLQRGRELLATITAGKLSAAIRPDAQWFTMQLNGKDIGFICRSEATARQNDNDGVEVTLWSYVKVTPDDQPRLDKQVLFQAGDGSMDRWKEQLQIGTGAPGTLSVAEDGGRVADTVICMVDQNGKVDSKRHKVPDVPYLSRAGGVLLPRLVNLSKPQSYAFGTYTTARNDFDMRTFTVVGPEKATIAERTVNAIKVIDQLAADAEEATLYLTEQGDMLRMATPDGLVIESATRQQVIERFANAEQLIQSTAKWASQK